MRKNSGILFGLILSAALLAAGPALATMENQKAFKQSYPAKAGRTAPGCKMCHQGAIGKSSQDLNPYGADLKKGANPKKLTEADFKAIETEDSDKDGASNGAEIAAGTQPGDPASAPGGK